MLEPALEGEAKDGALDRLAGCETLAFAQPNGFSGGHASIVARSANFWRLVVYFAPHCGSVFGTVPCTKKLSTAWLTHSSAGDVSLL